MCYSSESDNGARCTVVRTTSGVDVRHGSADIHQSPITIHDSRRDGSMATSESERMLGLIDDTCCVNGSAEGEQRMDRARRIVHNVCQSRGWTHVLDPFTVDGTIVSTAEGVP